MPQREENGVSLVLPDNRGLLVLIELQLFVYVSNSKVCGFYVDGSGREQHTEE